MISIHAPTRGATLVDGVTGSDRYISIHAPTRGATYDQDMYNEQAVNFNPRSHERSDRNLQLSFFPYSISIHAPTRGATVRRSFLSEPIDDFNPRSHERSDMQAVLMMVIKATFQSTLPREERRYVPKVDLLTFINFNPRSHERSDLVQRE